MKFSDNFLKYRKLRGLTQEAIADQLQVSRQSVSKWENGEALPDLMKIIKISELLDVSLDELCGRNVGDKTDAKQTMSMENVPGKARNTSKFKIGIIIVGIVLFGIVGYFLGSNAESSTYQALEKMNATGVEFDVERRKLTCKFVPSVFSEKFQYTVYAYDSEGKEKESDVEFRDAVGSAMLHVEDCQFYKVVLVVESDEESRNIVLAEQLYIDKDFKGTTLH